MSLRQLRRGLRPGRRPCICYHEAGHCVALWYLGYTFCRVSVLTAEEFRQGLRLINQHGEQLAGAEGCVVGHDPDPDPGPDPEVLELLGAPPEAVAQARRALQADTEMNLVCIYAGITAEARYQKCGREWLLFTTGAGDSASGRHLRDTWLSDPTAREQAISLADRIVVALVRSEAGWQAITAIAKALIDRGELSGDEADSLCAAAYGHKQPSQKTWKDSWPPDLRMVRAGRVP